MPKPVLPPVQRDRLDAQIVDAIKRRQETHPEICAATRGLVLELIGDDADVARVITRALVSLRKRGIIRSIKELLDDGTTRHANVIVRGGGRQAWA